jgi:hypothetical protein
LRKSFRKWIIDHIDSWFAFGQSLELEIERMEDIILVTGCHLTQSFVNAAFSKSQNDIKATLGLHAGDATAEVEWRFSRKSIHGAMVKYGPDGDVRPYNLLSDVKPETSLTCTGGFRTFSKTSVFLCGDSVLLVVYGSSQ